HQAALEARANGGTFRPLSLYVHISFCESICHYCASTRPVHRADNHVNRYLAALRREAEWVRDSLTGVSPMTQLHLGGGVPTSLSDSKLDGLVHLLESMFAFAANAQRSIEVDPHTIDLTRLHALRALDFNRISFGIQDFTVGRRNAGL